MSERVEGESYWQGDLALGEIELEGTRYPLRMRLHRPRESYQERRELVPLEVSSGERIYLHATPYLLIPEMQLTVDIDPSPQTITSNGSGASERSDRAIGEVSAAVPRPGSRELSGLVLSIRAAERVLGVSIVRLVPGGRSVD